MNKLRLKIIRSTLIIVAALANLQLRAELVFPADYHYTNSAVVDGLKLVIGTTNDVFASGQSIVLTVSLQNTTTNDIMTAARIPLYFITVVGPDEKEVPKTEIGRNELESVFGGGRGLQIKANESYTTPWYLNKMFSMTNAGRYSITVSWKSPKWTAGPLKVTVTEPKRSK